MNSNNHITVDQIKNDAEVIKKRTGGVAALFACSSRAFI